MVPAAIPLVARDILVDWREGVQVGMMKRAGQVEEAHLKRECRRPLAHSQQKVGQLCVLPPQRKEFFQQSKGAWMWILLQSGLQMKMQSS